MAQAIFGQILAYQMLVFSADVDHVPIYGVARVSLLSLHGYLSRAYVDSLSSRFQSCISLLISFLDSLDSHRFPIHSEINVDSTNISLLDNVLCSKRCDHFSSHQSAFILLYLVVYL